jgi:hypothetical protein
MNSWSRALVGRDSQADEAPRSLTTCRSAADFHPAQFLRHAIHGVGWSLRPMRTPRCPGRPRRRGTAPGSSERALQRGTMPGAPRFAARALESMPTLRNPALYGRSCAGFGRSGALGRANKGATFRELCAADRDDGLAEKDDAMLRPSLDAGGAQRVSSAWGSKRHRCSALPAPSGSARNHGRTE